MPVVTGSVTAVFSGILLVIAQIKPSGSTRFLDFNAAGSIIYYHGDRSATMATAEAFCKALGGRLPASIDELSTFALNNPAYKMDEFWLGPVKKVGSVYIWPDGQHVNHYHFNYKKWEPAPISCEYMCCAITGKVVSQGQPGTRVLVKPFEEVPCHTHRKPLCVITSPPGRTVQAVNESLKEFYTGYKGLMKKVGSFDTDRKKLKIAFDSFKKDLDQNKNLWSELETNYIGSASEPANESPSSPALGLNEEFIFTNDDSGRKYFYDGNSTTYATAKESCERIQGSLPVVRNESDAFFIKKLVGLFRFTWLASERKQPLTYTWADGSPVDVSFKSGYPKCQGPCCQLALYSSDLVDLECFNHAMVICDVTPKAKRDDGGDSSDLDDKISSLKKRLSIQKKAMTELVKSFQKFVLNAPATGSLFG